MGRVETMRTVLTGRAAICHEISHVVEHALSDTGRRPPGLLHTLPFAVIMFL